MGIFKHGIKRVVVLKFSLSCCENMFAGKTPEEKQRKMIHWEFGLVGSKLGALASVDEFMQVKSQQRPAHMAFLFRLRFGFLELPKNVNPHLPPANMQLCKCCTE